MLCVEFCFTWAVWPESPQSAALSSIKINGSNGRLNRKSFEPLTNPFHDKICWSLHSFVFPCRKERAHRGHALNWLQFRSLMDQFGLVSWLSGGIRGRSSPQVPRKVRGWTSSAAERCSSGTARSRTVRTQEMRGSVTWRATTHWQTQHAAFWQRLKVRWVLWAAGRRSSSRSCSARPRHTASLAPYIHSSPCWAIRQSTQRDINHVQRKLKWFLKQKAVSCQHVVWNKIMLS